jgi:ABC-type glutathione transport system ATPase component
MSGGEQQRVAIAVSLANYPRLLLADEPTGEVDSQMAQEILASLRNLNRELGVTIIIVTHDPRIASNVDRVIAIRDGRTSTETTRQILAPLQSGESDDVVEPEEGQELEHEVTYEELVVLDTAGRLQIPRDYLEELRIGDRARVELTDEGILIQPVEGRETVERISDEDAWEIQVSGLYVQEDEPPSSRPKQALKWLGQRLSRTKSKQKEG